jgi:hypothetical protein
MGKLCDIHNHWLNIEKLLVLTSTREHVNFVFWVIALHGSILFQTLRAISPELEVNEYDPRSALKWKYVNIRN